MPKSLKAITYAAGAFIGLLVIVGFVLSVFLDLNAYKSRIEAAAPAGRSGPRIVPRLT